MAAEYIVLRRRRPQSPSAFSIVVPAGASKTTPDGLTAEVVSDETALKAVRNSNDFEHAARSMAISLIRPKARAAVVPASLPSVAWGVSAVGADTSRFDGSGVVVAVLDTGINAAHDAFKGVQIVERDFTGIGNGDTDGHGTHCAGTIFGRDVDGVRIGIARGVTRALIGKVIAGNSGQTAWIISAIQWAIENGAHVISMSLGIDFPGFQAQLQREGMRAEPATSLALEAYRDNVRIFDSSSSLVNALAVAHQPCLLVAAAGNESGRGETPPFEIAASPPAASQGFVAVAALQEGASGLTVAPFSNTNPALAAPGVKILSADAAGRLVEMDGTSMATPHVAGVAALWAQKLMAARQFKLATYGAAVQDSADMRRIDPAMTLATVGSGIVRAPQN